MIPAQPMIPASTGVGSENRCGGRIEASASGSLAAFDPQCSRVIKLGARPPATSECHSKPPWPLLFWTSFTHGRQNRLPESSCFVIVDVQVSFGTQHSTTQPLTFCGSGIFSSDCVTLAVGLLTVPTLTLTGLSKYSCKESEATFVSNGKAL